MPVIYVESQDAESMSEDHASLRRSGGKSVLDSRS